MLEQNLFLEYSKSRDFEIRNKIVEEHLYLVEILIKKYLHKGVDYDDLYQVGAMALVSAVERFNPEKGFEFSSFATPTILGEIKRYFRDKEWRMKVPRRVKEISIQIPKAKEKLLAETGRMPTVEELAEYMKLSNEEVIEAMESGNAYNTFSLEQAAEDDQIVTFDKFASIEEKGYGSVEDFDVIKRVLVNLKDNEKKIFKMRYVQDKTQTEIAKTLGISQMTVSRAEKSIRKKFHEELCR